MSVKLQQTNKIFGWAVSCTRTILAVTLKYFSLSFSVSFSCASEGSLLNPQVFAPDCSKIPVEDSPRKTEYVGTGPDNSVPQDSTVIGKNGSAVTWRRMKILPARRQLHSAKQNGIIVSTPCSAHLCPLSDFHFIQTAQTVFIIITIINLRFINWNAIFKYTHINWEIASNNIF